MMFPPNIESSEIESPNIRVLVVDDHLAIRDGLTVMLRSEPGMELVGIAKTGAEAISQFKALAPDITLIDLNLPEVSGIEVIAAIIESAPDAKLIILTTYDGDEDIYTGLRAGAKSYLLKAFDRDKMLATIRQVYAEKE